MQLTLLKIRNALIGKRINIMLYPKSLKNSFIILDILYKEGFILSYFYNKLINGISITFNYIQSGSILSIIKIFKKKNFCINLSYKDLCIFKELNCLLILSTNLGIMNHFNALKLKIGGKLVCFLR